MAVETLTPDAEVEDILEAPEVTVPETDPAVELSKAVEMARLIDVHLDYERQSRLPLSVDDLTPRRLCSEQRTDLATDLYAATR